MNRKITDKILSCIADASIEALLASMGIPSFGGSYEPERSADMKAYKKDHPSKIDKLFNKFVK